MIRPNLENQTQFKTKKAAPARTRKKSARPRVRLTPKQARFINRIIDCGYTVEAAMDELSIWPRMLDNWLNQPRFNEALEFKLSQYRLQARINAALFAPSAVRTLGYMFDTKADFETKRKASVDLLKFHQFMNPDKPSPKKEKPSKPETATNSGTAVASGGFRPANDGTQKSPQNPVSSPKTKKSDENGDWYVLPEGQVGPVPAFVRQQGDPSSHPERFVASKRSEDGSEESDLLRRPNRVECERTDLQKTNLTASEVAPIAPDENSKNRRYQHVYRTRTEKI